MTSVLPVCDWRPSHDGVGVEQGEPFRLLLPFCLPVDDDSAVHAEGQRPVVVVGQRPELVLREERLVLD